MVFRRLFTAAGFGVGVLVGTVHFMGTAGSMGINGAGIKSPPKTLGLAPISLGNPSAALPGLRMTAPSIPVDDVTVTEPKLIYQTYRAGKGDTLAALLGRAGATKREAHDAIVAVKKHFNPRKFRRGQEVRVAIEPADATTAKSAAVIGAFKGFSLRLAPTTEIRVLRDVDGAFRAVEKQRRLAHELARADGVIGTSLYLAGKKAGLPNSALVELIRAYSWDVDFQRDIRKGDAFQVLYERVNDEDGNLVKAGRIIHAMLSVGGKAISTYRFKTRDGHVNYYDEEGRSARKALMRTPIDGARLSSGFGLRKHPILGYTKRHTGVDFAAPRGTPIYAAGNGTITYAGRKGGYGNYMKIRHNSTYSTAYAHMKGFARGMRSGKRVSQGQVIGYVGSTGRSTGPHLHYEIIRNGRFANPLRVKMPSGKKLKGDELARFHKERKRIDRKFAALATSKTLVAQNK